VCLGFLFILFCSEARAGTDHIAARHLVRVAQLDRAALELIPHYYFPRADQNDPVFAEFRSCIVAADSSGVADVLAGAVDASLTDSEVRAAHAFYASAVGKKHAVQMRRYTQAQLGNPVTDPEPGFSAEEKSRLAAFVESPAGRKTAIDRLVLVSRTTSRLFDYGLQLASKCKPQSAP
jgi:hypothetical protein